jgi:hypothetical protein
MAMGQIAMWFTLFNKELERTPVKAIIAVNNFHTNISGSVKNCLNHSYFRKPIARSRSIQI